jgi:hypothetical protein
MIRIELGKEVSPGIWEYTVPSLGLCGRSRQPLLDACRQIERILGATTKRAGVFREGRDAPDISCPVAAGAEVTVSERDKGGIRFGKYQPDPRFAMREAA